MRVPSRALGEVADRTQMRSLMGRRNRQRSVAVAFLALALLIAHAWCGCIPLLGVGDATASSGSGDGGRHQAHECCGEDVGPRQAGDHHRPTGQPQGGHGSDCDRCGSEELGATPTMAVPVPALVLQGTLLPDRDVVPAERHLAFRACGSRGSPPSRQTLRAKCVLVI